jgi:hypothetical protein
VGFQSFTLGGVGSSGTTPEGGGAIDPVANAAELSALANTVEYVTVFVKSYRDYLLSSNRSSPPALSANVILPHASGGNWRWERLCIPHPSWAAQATFYINASASASALTNLGTFAGGSDEADGADIARPIKTNAELLRRLGTAFASKIAQTVLAVGALDPLVMGVLCPPSAGGSFHYRGALLPVTTTAISSVVNAAPATNVDSSFHGDAGWTSSAELSRLVIDSVGNSAWVIEQGGGLSGGVADAVVSPWQADLVTVPTATSPASTNTANGRTVTSYVHGATLAAATVTTSGNFVAFSDIKFDGGFSRFSSQGANLFLNRCIFGGSAHTCRFSGGNIYRNGCLFASGLAAGIDGNDNYTRTFSNGGLSRVAWSTGSTTPSGVTIRNNIVFNAVGYGVSARSADLLLDGVCFRNVTSGSLFSCTGLGKARINGAVWGVGNTVPIAALERGSRITTNQAASAITVVRSAASDFTFGGDATARAFDKAVGTFTAARTLNWANLEASVATTGFGNTMGDPANDCYVLKT